MKLRDHPFMIRKSGFKNWPPLWTPMRRGEYNKTTAQLGTLSYALMNDLFDNKIFLMMEYKNERYISALHFDDSTFCYQLCSILKAHIGASIQDIGDLNLFHTL
jgi:hypothetical protein